MQRAIHFKALVLAMASVGLVSLPHLATANPSGGQVVAGNATIHLETASKIGITQTTNKAIIDWQKFSIGANEHVQFYQPSASSVTLNRVVGQDPSQILGRLTANGQVFLVNPNGIYFGKNAQIDVAGLVASTHNIRNEDFMADRYVFDIPGKPGAAVINEGQIRIADTGVAAFIAPSVANRGIIAAKLGKIALASANGFTLDFHGDDLVAFLVSDEVAKTAFDLDGTPLLSFVENSGKIEAQGGYVLLSAKAAENAIHSVINQSGIIEATSVGQQNGEIVLAGGQYGVVSNTGTLDGSGKGTGETGGKVQITGEKIALLSGTNINVAGDQGGGTVLVGGDYLGGDATPEQLAETGMVLETTDIPTSTNVSVANDAQIHADALTHGNGGKVILWADNQLSFDGLISAKGGQKSGDGGKVETSGKVELLVKGIVDASAVRGQAGLWFMDPTHVRIANSGGTVSAQQISQALSSGTSVTVSTANCASRICTISSGSGLGSIQVLSDIVKSAGGAATLNLQTYDGAIIVNQGARIYSTSGPLNVNINARHGNSNPGYALVAIGNDSNYAIETNGGQVDITALIQTYQGKAIKTNGGKVLARTTPTPNDSDSRGFIGIGPVPVNATSAYTINAGNGEVIMRATDGTITLDDHAITANTVSLNGNVYARPNILSFNMADEASRSVIESGFGGSSGYGTNFPGNDDNSTSVSIASLSGNGLTMLGQNFGDTIYLSNNGYMRFDVGSGAYTPYSLSSTNNPIVAAYFGDVDTRGTGSVYYATRATNNDNKAILTWIGTGYYSYGTNKTNTFQLQVENLGVETNMRLSYQQLQWTTGSASGGSNGLGGVVARAGIAIPGANETIRFELPSSGRQTDMLALASLPGNTGKVGVWSFRLWPEATPPNLRNGRFEVAANTLTVNGSSSGHQLERGAPGSSNSENADRRQTEDYFSQLLVNRFAYRGQQEKPPSDLIVIEDPGSDPNKSADHIGGVKSIIGHVNNIYSILDPATTDLRKLDQVKTMIAGLNKNKNSINSILGELKSLHSNSTLDDVIKILETNDASQLDRAFVEDVIASFYRQDGHSTIETGIQKIESQIKSGTKTQNDLTNQAAKFKILSDILTVFESLGVLHDSYQIINKVRNNTATNDDFLQYYIGAGGYTTGGVGSLLSTYAPGTSTLGKIMGYSGAALQGVAIGSGMVFGSAKLSDMLMGTMGLSISDLYSDSAQVATTELNNLIIGIGDNISYFATTPTERIPSGSPEKYKNDLVSYRKSQIEESIKRLEVERETVTSFLSHFISNANLIPEKRENTVKYIDEVIGKLNQAYLSYNEIVNENYATGRTIFLQNELIDKLHDK